MSLKMGVPQLVPSVVFTYIYFEMLGFDLSMNFAAAKKLPLQENFHLVLLVYMWYDISCYHSMTTYSYLSTR